MTPRYILHWLNHNSYWLSHHVSHPLLAFTIVCSPFSKKNTQQIWQIMPDRDSYCLKHLENRSLLHTFHLFPGFLLPFPQPFPRTAAPWSSCSRPRATPRRPTRTATPHCTRQRAVATWRRCCCCCKRTRRWMAEAVAWSVGGWPLLGDC